ncbi:hypothetical protein [Microbacterium dauci]|uniref:Uncharacterized protein n=1 Tax=Microbacterium dauci TaxID=3048008 RepID=A0ABT6ZBZ6_9MICO|nr:hypothetical protein [Microbacterium sp. LX3-4]MDJ1113220.1 hypothetical protein [Microbacterium sp. LX3-4]
MLGLPVEAAPTALGLLRLAGASPMLLDPARVAAQLYPSESRLSSTERVVLHVVMLEEAGYLRTWVEEGTEWLQLLDATAPAAPHVTSTAFRDAFSAPLADPFSSAGEREKEREKRAGARERARAQAQAEERAWEARWADHAQRPASRPERPRLLNAPPIGCHEHPNGTSTPCGPCGTAAEYRRQWLAREKYVEQLAIFEETNGVDDDEPF